MIAQRIPVPEESQACWWIRWGISAQLARGLELIAQELAPIPINIISGYRTPEHQDKLRKEGRPTAPNDKSTHLSCPATGADIRLPTVAVTDSVKAQFGRIVTFVGLRWGGGSSVDPETGIPSDWNHVDTGPRTTQ